MWGCFQLIPIFYFFAGVFPMHVGVFLALNNILDKVDGLPHACGGVSTLLLFLKYRNMVFPMHVGVFLKSGDSVRAAQGLPHACGGVSTKNRVIGVEMVSSPCMWGCFYRSGWTICCQSVFPMHVGVFLRFQVQQDCARSLPHACGGVSVFPVSANGFQLSSPCMWGCFQRRLK